MNRFAWPVTLLMVWVSAIAQAQVDPWAAIRRLVGEWSGTSSGQPGDGNVVRRYSFVLNDRYLHETNTSEYPPHERNKKGERHEHWGLFSYDQQHKALVLRHFHVEGFVNTYMQVAAAGAPDAVVFESVAFENLVAEWKARETYQFVSDDEFIETFELAPPGKPYQPYSRALLKRVRR
jgi:hypothetical protein